MLPPPLVLPSLSFLATPGPAAFLIVLLTERQVWDDDRSFVLLWWLRDRRLSG